MHDENDVKQAMLLCVFLGIIMGYWLATIARAVV